MLDSREIASPLVFVVILVFGFAAYWPGLAGPFLFDDFANLTSLGKVGGVDDLESFLRFTFGGTAGPSGRPIALASFLIDDMAWPSEPYAFKRTNLLLHALNAALLCWVCFLICHRFSGFNYRSSTWIAVLAFSIWYLHPFLVSTTLLVVQRMAVLATTFVLTGLLVYLFGRLSLTKNRWAKGYALMTTSIVFVTPLAVLSKENGALLPILVGALEYTVCRQPNGKSETPHRLWSIIFIWTPLFLLLAYFARRVLRNLPHSLEFANREFSVYERVITQPRVLIDYLSNLFLPRLGTKGLYHDNYVYSTSLTDSHLTWLYLLIVVGLIVAAIFLRRKTPILSFAVLFFFAAHLLESSVVGLELYFEHRNYLPAAFLFLPVAVGVQRSRISRWIKLIVTFVLILTPASLTYARAVGWSDGLLLHATWVERNPGSLRAQQAYADVLMLKGFHRAALEALEVGKDRIPDDVDLQLFYLRQKCLVEGVTYEDYKETLQKIAARKYLWKQYRSLEWAVKSLSSPSCRGLSFKQILELLDAFEDNSGTKRRGARMLLNHLRGVLFLERGDVALATSSFVESLKFQSDPEQGLYQVALLASGGFYREALEHLDLIQAERILTPSLIEKIYPRAYEQEIEILRSKIQEDLTRKQESVY